MLASDRESARQENELEKRHEMRCECTQLQGNNVSCTSNEHCNRKRLQI